MACSICDAIGQGATANTGRDERFDAPITSLQAIFKTRDNDLWQCPQCRSLYFWSEYVAFTGSGNNDDETISRVAEPLQRWLHAFEQRTDDTPAQIDELAPLLFALTENERDLILGYAGRTRDITPALIPHVLAQALRRNDPAIAKELESRAASNKAFAQRVLAAIKVTPSPLFDALAKVAELAQCSVCGTLRFESSKADAPKPTGFRHLTGANEDIWECTQCGTFFEYKPSLLHKDEQNLGRIADWQAKTLRSALHRASPDALDLDQLKDAMYWGEHNLSVLMRYAMANDEPLARALAPLFVQELAKTRKEWLGALLARFVDGNREHAALVRAAIDELPRLDDWYRPPIDQLAAKCG